MPAEVEPSQPSEPSSQPAAGAGLQGQAEANIALREGWLAPLDFAAEELEKVWKDEDFYLAVKKIRDGRVHMTLWAAMQEHRRSRHEINQSELARKA